MLLHFKVLLVFILSIHPFLLHLSMLLCYKCLFGLLPFNWYNSFFYEKRYRMSPQETNFKYLFRQTYSCHLNIEFILKDIISFKLRQQTGKSVPRFTSFTAQNSLSNSCGPGTLSPAARVLCPHQPLLWDKN